MSYDPVGAMTGGGDGLPGPSTTHVLTLPAGAAAGDLAVVHSTVLSTTATATITSGSGAWTLQSGPTAGYAGTSTMSYVWSKTLTSGDIGSNITVTWDASLRGLAVGVVYPPGSVSAIASSSAVGGSTSITGTAVTVTNGDTLLLIGSAKANSGVTIPSVTLPSGYTLDKNSASAGDPSANYRTAACHKAVTASGSGGNDTFTFSPSTNGVMSYTLALTPPPPPNVAPTVTTGANQDVAPGATVNVTSTATDSDGTIASRAWTFDYPTSGAPTLTGDTSANASFTAGAAGSLYILRHTATDNDGATGYATTEVRVPSTGTLAPLPGAGSGVGTFTNVGGAASEGAALSDASDTTYVESGVVSATEQSRRWRINPSGVRSTGTLTVRVAQDVAGALTAKVRLFEGTVQRQEWTITVTTTIADQALTLAGGTISAITDWGNLFVEVAATS